MHTFQTLSIISIVKASKNLTSTTATLKECPKQTNQRTILISSRNRCAAEQRLYLVQILKSLPMVTIRRPPINATYNTLTQQGYCFPLAHCLPQTVLLSFEAQPSAGAAGALPPSDVPPGIVLLPDLGSAATLDLPHFWARGIM